MKKMSNIEIQGGTENFSALFIHGPKAMKLNMPAIAENSNSILISVPTTENLNLLQKQTPIKKKSGAPRTTAFSTMSGFS